jgi:hypothetical protein
VLIVSRLTDCLLLDFLGLGLLGLLLNELLGGHLGLSGNRVARDYLCWIEGSGLLHDYLDCLCHLKLAWRHLFVPLQLSFELDDLPFELLYSLISAV